MTYFVYCHTSVRHLSQTKRPCADRPPHLFRARYLQIIADHWYYSLVLMGAISPKSYSYTAVYIRGDKDYARKT